MICRKCETESPEGSQFCARCGAPLGEAPANPIRKSPQILVLVAALMLVAGALGYAISHRGGQLPTAEVPKAPSNLAQAPIQPTQQLAQGVKTDIPAAPVASGTTNTPAPPPPEVVAYLAKLQKIEEARKAISMDTALASAMYQAASDPSTDSSQGVQGGFHNMISRLQALSQQVRTTAAPEICLPLGNSYLEVLSSHIKLVSTVQNALVKRDIAEAMALQTKIKPLNEADTAALKKADGELDKLCKATNAEKSFTIGD